MLQHNPLHLAVLASALVVASIDATPNSPRQKAAEQEPASAGSHHAANAQQDPSRATAGHNGETRAITWENGKPESPDNQASAKGHLMLPGLKMDRGSAAEAATFVIGELRKTELRDLIPEPQPAPATPLEGTADEGLANHVMFAGDFVSPGPWKIPPRFKPTVATTVLRSGGVTKRADLRKVMLIRVEIEGALPKATIWRFDLQSFLEGNSDRQDLPVHAGDLLIVPQI